MISFAAQGNLLPYCAARHIQSITQTAFHLRYRPIPEWQISWRSLRKIPPAPAYWPSVAAQPKIISCGPLSFREFLRREKLDGAIWRRSSSKRKRAVAFFQNARFDSVMTNSSQVNGIVPYSARTLSGRISPVQ